jgi:homoserine kinase
VRSWISRRLDIADRYDVGVVVPDFVLPTSHARSVLPDSYSREDAVFNVQRSALLIGALVTGTTAAFPTALEDRMHHKYRAPLVPGLDEILKLRAPGLLGCVLSGAGPSVLVFYERGSEGVCDLVRQIFSMRGHASELMPAKLCRKGYEVS